MRQERVDRVRYEGGAYWSGDSGVRKLSGAEYLGFAYDVERRIKESG